MPSGQIPAISVAPRCQCSCETETPLTTEAVPIPEYLPKERAETLSAAEDTGSPTASPGEERQDATCSPQVKTCGHRGEVLPTSRQLINALTKKNDWALLSGPKGRTHTRAFLCPQMRCCWWEPSLAHAVSPAMPWHCLGPCEWPGP